MKNHLPACSSFVDAYADDAASLILHNLPEAVLLFDTTLNLSYCNDAAREQMEQKRNIKVFTGMPWTLLVSPARQSFFKTVAADVLAGRTRTLETDDQLNPDGEIFEITLTPARDRTDNLIGILVRSVNVTEKKKAVRAVSEAEERWQFAFEASNQAAWDWNMQTNEIIYSSSYKKMYGFQGDELSNDVSEWMHRIHPEDRKQIEAAIEEHVRSDNPYYETKYRIQLKNGDYKWIMARGKLLEKDADGRPLRMIGTHTDLTETLKAKAEIRQMNERFHYAAKASSQALWEWNVETGEAYVSPGFTEMFGWQADENQHFEQWHHYVHPDDRKATVGGYYHILENTTETIWQASYRFLKANGTYAFVADKAYVLRDENNKAVKVIGATQDVTALIKAEEELFRSNERFGIMMKATHDMLWDWNIDEDSIYRSQEGMKNVYKLTDDRSIKTIGLWLQRIHPDDLEKVQDIFQSFEQAVHQQTFEVEYRFRCEDGSYTHIYNRGILLKNEAGKPVRMIGAAQNIAERKRLEAELLANVLDTKKRINQATVDSQEQERAEIGRELHDNVNQILTTTRLYLELALQNPDLSEELLKRSSDNIINVINEIRQLSRSLMNPTIGDLGLVAAVHDLVENLQLTRQVTIDFAVDDAIEALLDKKQKLTVFRIIQEALNNVMRHAGATFVAIALRFANGVATLTISDNGKGFAPEMVKKGAGLQNITNRVYLVNGRFDLDSATGKGCAIKIDFPV